MNKHTKENVIHLGKNLAILSGILLFCGGAWYAVGAAVNQLFSYFIG